MKPTIALIGGEEFADGFEDVHANLLELAFSNRSQKNGKPVQGVFLPTCATDEAFVEMLQSNKIFCLPGTVVEMPGYFRVSLTANDDMIQRAMPGFAAALEKARQIPQSM